MIKLVIIIAITSILSSCGGIDESGSQLSQLQNGPPSSCWMPDSRRISKMEDLLGDDFLKGFDGDEAITHLASLPDEYMEYLKNLKDRGIFRGISKGGVGFGALGITELVGFPGNNSIMTPVSIKIATSPGATRIAMQHEVGHAVQGHIFQKAPNTLKHNANFEEIYKLVKTSSFVRPYSKSQDVESFADLFSSYYCSPDSYNFVKNTLFKGKESLFEYLKETFKTPLFLVDEEEEESDSDIEKESPKKKPQTIHTLVVKNGEKDFDIWAAAIAKGASFSVCSKKGKCKVKEPIRSESNRSFYVVAKGTNLQSSITLKLTKGGKEIATKKVKNDMELHRTGGHYSD